MTGSGNDPVEGAAGEPAASRKGTDRPPSASSSFLRHLADRDERAWRRLAELYGPLVLHWCRKLGASLHDAEDVLQEVFRTVAGKAAGFDAHRPHSTFRGWLWTITRYKLRDLHRRKKREVAAAGGSDHQERLLALADAAGETEDATPPPDAGGLYHRCFDMIRQEFEEQSWQAFWRSAVEGRSARDVAAELGTTVNAVYLARSRILRRLREELGEE